MSDYIYERIDYVTGKRKVNVRPVELDLKVRNWIEAFAVGLAYKVLRAFAPRFSIVVLGDVIPFTAKENFISKETVISRKEAGELWEEKIKDRVYRTEDINELRFIEEETA